MVLFVKHLCSRFQFFSYLTVNCRICIDLAQLKDIYFFRIMPCKLENTLDKRPSKAKFFHFLLPFLVCVAPLEEAECTDCRQKVCASLEDECHEQDTISSERCCECSGSTYYNGTACVRAEACTCKDSTGKICASLKPKQSELLRPKI